MKPNFSVRDLATVLYNSTDHSCITDHFGGYDYSVMVTPDGNFWNGNRENEDEAQEFNLSFRFNPDAMWDGIDRERFEKNDMDAWEQDRVAYLLLDRADEQEDWSNPEFRDCAEKLYDSICDWLDEQHR